VDDEVAERPLAHRAGLGHAVLADLGDEVAPGALLGLDGRGELPAGLDPDDIDEGRPWWDPKRVADVGGRKRRAAWSTTVVGRMDSPWTTERVAIERCRVLRRLGRYADAEAAWLGLAHGRGAIAVQAWIEVAKLREHRLADPDGALEAARRAATFAEGRRRLGLGDPPTERALRARLERLGRRVESAGLRQAATRSRAIATDPPPPRQSVASP
jgi:hypothetical protein